MVWHMFRWFIAFSSVTCLIDVVFRIARVVLVKDKALDIKIDLQMLYFSHNRKSYKAKFPSSLNNIQYNNYQYCTIEMSSAPACQKCFSPSICLLQND